jgi:ankyrin repeat protein
MATLNLHERLVEAAGAGDAAAAKALVAAGADPNYQTAQINTPLMWAATHRHLEAAKALLESGADVNRQDVLGGTALIVAAGNGDVPMLELLLRAGADPDLRDHDGHTAAAWATHGNHAEAVRILQEWPQADAAAGPRSRTPRRSPSPARRRRAGRRR